VLRFALLARVFDFNAAAIRCILASPASLNQPYKSKADTQ